MIKFEGISLNNVLLKGPDLNNILGVLLRFQQEPIAFTADMQQMFYCFVVQEEDSFLWFKNKEAMKYIMKVHVFGNSHSPAVAVYCMRELLELERQNMVLMQDRWLKGSSMEEYIDMLLRTKQMLTESNL